MTTVPHPVPSRLSHLTAALYGREDDTLIAWQRACAQAAETRRGQHDEERLRKALTLAQDGAVELHDGFALVASGNAHYQVQEGGACNCPDHARRGGPCKHLLAVHLHQDALALLWVPEEPLKAPLPGAEPPRAWMPPPAPSAPTARAATTWDVHEAQTSACVRVRIGDMEVTYTIRGTTDDDVLTRLDATLQPLFDTCEVHQRRAAERAKARAAVLAEAHPAAALTPAELHTLLEQTAQQAVQQALAAQSHGAAATGHATGHTPTSPPRCPAHGDMRESTKQPGTWFCTQKLPNGKYCPSKA